MGSLCDFCGTQRSMIYCRSDTASLCLSCDRNVHSANTLSKRHSRTLLCERCNSQPAIVRCVEENASLCHNCDWNGHSNLPSNNEHKRRAINCYSGCPSAAELSRIWPFITEFPQIVDSNCEEGIGLMSISENHVSTCWGAPGGNSNGEVTMKDIDNAWIGSSSKSAENVPASGESTTPKFSGSETKDTEMCKGGFFEDFKVDDVDLTFENYEELFGGPNDQSGQFFDDVGFDCFFDTKEMPCPGELMGEASVKNVKSMQPEYSNAASADSMNKAELSVSSLPARPARSSISLTFSGMTGESSAGEFTEMSSMLLMGEPPWYTTGAECSSYAVASRDSAVLRYREKKKNRKY